MSLICKYLLVLVLSTKSFMQAYFGKLEIFATTKEEQGNVMISSFSRQQSESINRLMTTVKSDGLH